MQISQIYVFYQVFDHVALHILCKNHKNTVTGIL